RMQRGGHFACLEQPELFARDVREFFERDRSPAMDRTTSQKTSPTTRVSIRRAEGQEGTRKRCDRGRKVLYSRTSFGTTLLAGVGPTRATSLPLAPRAPALLRADRSVDGVA